MSERQWVELKALVKSGGRALAGPDQGALLCDFDNLAVRFEEHA